VTFEVMEVLSNKVMRLWEYYGYSEKDFLELIDTDQSLARELNKKICIQKLLVLLGSGELVDCIKKTNIETGGKIYNVGDMGVMYEV